jgi:magnesium chelatase subunit D
LAAPLPGARPNVIATLRAAAPWQKLRRDLPGPTPRHLVVRHSDFRYTRYRDHDEATAIFAVDASGSTAFDRLNEAKGAIELLLGDCYVRRNSVAMIAFRGRQADILLEPTRSLVRAKRTLTALPGGGATPLANGIACSLELATQVRRRGTSPLLVFLTDGRANIALDGTADRCLALADAKRLATQGAALGFRSLIIDIARRPRETARDIAAAMGADYQLLPKGGAAGVSGLVSSYLPGD